ncbi:MAG TPA: HAD family hydrolase [Bacteroidia bacterium]|jgi:histidinol-phosphate phosphatase family protein|nr:HAD family hydrolase [Bacteroidia bacterium]
MKNILSDWNIDKSWTLFLDRDGVINKRFPGDYVKRVDEFEFLPGVLDTIVELSVLFGRLIVVTNQQGIGKGLYTHDDLLKIHDHMTEEVEKAGGKIDAVFYAPQLKEENSPMRKPGIGMALQAKKIFPEIEFSKSIMIGDSPGDMEFGKRAGMKTVFVGKKEDAGVAVDAAIDALEKFLEFRS